MKRFACAALALAFLGLSAPDSASAQLSIGAGAGPTFPTGDYGDYAKTGWLGFGGVTYTLESGLGITGAGYFGSNGHDGSDDKTNLYGALAGLGYSFDTGGGVVPGVFGMVGTMTHKYVPSTGSSSSETKIAYGGGAELGFPLGSVGLFVNGWFLTASFDGSSTSIIGTSAGVNVPLGGGGM